MVDVLNDTELNGRKITKEELQRTVVGMLESRSTMPYDPSPGTVRQYARARVTYDAPSKSETTVSESTVPEYEESRETP